MRRHQSSIVAWLERLSEHHEGAARLVFPIFLLAEFSVALIVYWTGGIKFVYSHSMYVPILLSGLVYGFHGGVLFALIGGIALGPFMPIDTATGEMQQSINWIYRTGFFVFAGILSGLASDSFRAHVRTLQWSSRHDPQSGLPNRAALLADLNSFGAFHPGTGACVLAVVAFDNIAELKSAFGIDVVEDIVAQTAQRFQSTGNASVEVYRSSQEQVAGVASAASGDDIDRFLEELIRTLQLPFRVGEVPVHADARIGYVRMSAPRAQPTAPDALLLEAEAASFTAHRSGRDSLAYDASFSAAAKENLSILAQLRQALDSEDLSLHYQPKVALQAGELCGVEALIRWKHRQRGWIAPDVFIPRAEQSTLIQGIVEFSLAQAMRQITEWLHRDMRIPIAVNVSPRNLAHPGFADKVLQLLECHALAGEMLELEITESALMTDMERTIGELNRLARHGIRISLDDFGTGYSSLQYLHRLPISSIKIDQSFVRRALSEEGALHIIESAVSLARKMGIKTVAEGVETENAFDLLRRVGCDIAQGYAICRPLSEAELGSWYARHRHGFSFANA
jgi:predicted signal transduction protein with EAL and GGDEF domain